MDALYAWLAELARAGVLPGMFEYPFVVRGLIAACIIAPLLGGMSHLVLTRRLAFLSAALGQAALTGLTIGIMLGEPIDSAYGGIFGFCLLAALAMVWVRRRTVIPTDTLVGVFLAMTLGLGICLLVAVTKRFNVHQIEAVMFGSLLTVTDRDLAIALVVAVIVGVTLALRYDGLVLESLSPTLARVRGVRVALDEYLFVVLLTVTIVVSLKIVGALLVEALVVIPAAAARNLSKTLRGYVAWSIAIAWVGTEAGLVVSTKVEVPSGGAVVLSLAALFIASLAVPAIAARRRRR
ncbi:metal ABC transporter permease [Myxococcota bacterium]|nr:metal ABC transporter permease [Myxococcota bacterium]